MVNCNFTKERADGNLRRWMSGNFHVKDLDKNAQVTAVYFYYFPLWYIKIKDTSTERIYLQPAHSTSISEIKNIDIPAGNLKLFQKKEHNMKDFINPDIQLSAAQSWLKSSGVPVENATETSLVHIPLYQFYYNYNGKQYTAIVEASSGKVYANTWPAKSETPFRLLFGSSIGLLLLASILSLIVALAASDGSEGWIFLYEVIKVFLYILIFIPLVIIAYIIAKKV